MHLRVFSATSSVLPLTPVIEQKMSVNQLILTLIPVKNDIRLTAYKDPIPDNADNVKALIK